MYCFTCFSNSLGPIKYTKSNKVPISTLHFENVPLSGYISDIFTKGYTFSICGESITKQCVVINFNKSQIVLTQKVTILGFAIDSVKMIVTLTEEKKQKLKI